MLIVFLCWEGGMWQTMNLEHKACWDIYSGEGGSVVLKWPIKQTKTKQKPEFDIKWEKFKSTGVEGTCKSTD